MSRPRTGSAYKHGDHYDIRLTLPDGSRSKPICMPKEMSYAKAKDKAQVLTDLAAKQPMPNAADVPGSAVPVARGAQLAPQIGAALIASPATETFDDYLERWLGDREARGLTSVGDDRSRLTKHVLPRLRGKRMVDVTSEHLEDIVEALDQLVLTEQLEWLTAGHIWRAMRKLFTDSCRAKKRALRVRKDNPAAAVAPPDRGVKKSKGYIYPTEFLRLVSDERVPLMWRTIYALSIYLYCRAGELEALALDAIDPERGIIHIHRGMDRYRKKVKSTKNKQARRFSVEAEIFPLLVARFNEAKDAGASTLIPKMPRIEKLSVMFRAHLKLVGVNRAELFINDKTRKHITFHDLRATGLTWMAVRGDDPLKIKHRAGHISFSTTEGYIREAEQVRDGFGDVFPKLPASLVPAPPSGPLTTSGAACGSSAGSCEAAPVRAATRVCAESSRHDVASQAALVDALGCSPAQRSGSFVELMSPSLLAQLAALVSSVDSSGESSEEGPDLRNLRSRFRDLNSRPTVYETVALPLS